MGINVLRNYRKEDWHTDEGALRCIAHILSGVALEIAKNNAISDAHLKDLENILKDSTLWPETKESIKALVAAQKKE